MIRSKKRLWLCGTLIVLNVMFIWGNSLLTREISSMISTLVGKILSILFPGPVDPSEGTGHGILRKIAHVTEFCSLGLLLSWGVRMLREKTWEFFVFPAAIGVAVAAVDETIQIFSPGRGPHIRDVAIDFIGVFTGILILALINWIHKKASGSK